MVRTALELKCVFPGISVWSAPFLKPIDEAQVAAIARAHRCIVTIEEHSVLGGLGSIIAEITSATHPAPVLRIGVNDRFSHCCGSYQYLLKEHGLDRVTVVDKIRTFVAMQRIAVDENAEMYIKAASF
jgi:transketolase